MEERGRLSVGIRKNNYSQNRNESLQKNQSCDLTASDNGEQMRNNPRHGWKLHAMRHPTASSGEKSFRIAALCLELFAGCSESFQRKAGLGAAVCHRRKSVPAFLYHVGVVVAASLKSCSCY